MLYALGDKAPQCFGEGIYIAPDARVIGDVHLHANASIWWGCVIRGDNPDTIVIGQGSNVQDLTVIHTDPGQPTIIGQNCTIGHRALLHGCHIGDTTMVGMGSVVLNGARIGNNSMVGAGSLITENKIFPDGVLIVGRPAKVVRDLTPDEIAKLTTLAHKYQRWGQTYAQQLRPLS